MGLKVSQQKKDLDELDLGPRPKAIENLTARDVYMKYAEAMEDQGVDVDVWELMSHREQSAWHSMLLWVRQ
jgi:trans-aconitate methyltransferase